MDADLTPQQRDDLAGLLGDMGRLELIFEQWDETPRSAVEAYRRAIETLHGEALRRLVRALKSEPAALSAMKEALRDEIVYAVMRRHGIVKPSLNERIDAALAGVRPMLAAHGGDVELVRVEPPSIEVRFVGACDGCPASTMTFHQGVERAVKEACPEITSIVQVKGSCTSNGAEHAAGSHHLISPFELQRGGGWRFALELAKLPDGTVRAVEIDGEGVLLARRGATVTCFDNACAHMGLPLERGLVDEGVLTCPHHGFQYDLASGECLTAPVQLQLRVVRVVGERVEVRVGR